MATATSDAPPQYIGSKETMAKPTAKRKDFADFLTTDRLISIYVGAEYGEESSKTPFLVPQSTLCSASEYFAKAINYECLGSSSGQSGVLMFPMDCRETWQIMLYWIVKRSLPKVLQGYEEGGKDDACLIRAWIYGDRYILPDFQDEVMLKILDNLEFSSQPVEWPGFQVLVETFRETLPGCPLRKIAAEQLVYGDGIGVFGPTALDALDGIPGATRSILDAIDETREVDSDGFHVFAGPMPRWKSFMVGEWPKKDWIARVIGGHA